MPRRRLLIVSVEEPTLFNGGVRSRHLEISSEEVSSLDAARTALKRETWDGVLLPAGLKQLSLKSFLKLVPATTRVMVIDEEVPGTTRVPGRSSEATADAVFAALGL